MILPFKSIGQVCDIICGQDYKSVQDNDGAYPVYGTGGIICYASQYRCPANSVIIGRKGTINSPIFVEEPFWNVDTAFGMVPKQNELIPKYFFYFCKFYDFTKHDVSVTIPSLRRTDILKIQLPVPSLKEQKRIVAELDLLTGIIDKQKAQLGELDTLAQSIFYDMFGDPIENEKGWKVTKLGKALKTTSGGTPSKEHPEYYENGNIPWVNSGDLHQMFLNDIPKHITQAGVDNSSAKLFPVDTCLVAMYGATVGEVSILKIESTTNQAICGIFPSKNYSPIFLYFTLKYSKKHFVELASGGAQPNISQSIIKNFDLITPSIALQESFAQKIQSIESQKESINRSIAETQKLFDYTMDKYFG